MSTPTCIVWKMSLEQSQNARHIPVVGLVSHVGFTPSRKNAAERKIGNVVAVSMAANVESWTLDLTAFDWIKYSTPPQEDSRANKSPNWLPEMVSGPIWYRCVSGKSALQSSLLITRAVTWQSNWHEEQCVSLTSKLVIWCVGSEIEKLNNMQIGYAEPTNMVVVKITTEF